MNLPFTLPDFSPPHLDLTFFAGAGGILLIDLVLSGDNALVIGATASRLPRARRMLAIIFGGLGAIVFRLLLAGVATTLLQVALLRAIGGVILIFIAIRLLVGVGNDGDQRDRFRAHERLFPAILTILLADATMSLDNVLAVGALAHGDLFLLAAGLTLSMALLFVASALIAQIVDRFSWLIDLAAVVLAWTAAGLVLDDDVVRSQFPDAQPWSLYVRLGAVAFVVLIDIGLRLARGRRRPAPQASANTYVAVDEADEARQREAALEEEATG